MISRKFGPKVTVGEFGRDWWVVCGEVIRKLKEES